MSYSDVEVSHEGKKTYYCPFSDVYTHFYSILPSTYKFSMKYTLAFRDISICSDFAKFHNDLRFLKSLFLKNGYSASFINKCFKTF